MKRQLLNTALATVLLTVYITVSAQETDRNTNWLPSTMSGQFFLVMRIYMPGVEIVEQKWAPPPVVVDAQ